MPAKKKRSPATKAKARAKSMTTKARKKLARAIAPKPKRRKPKTFGQKVSAAMSSMVEAVMGKPK